jgi:hypothetical protein
MKPSKAVPNHWKPSDMYLDGDISTERWRTTAPITWAEGSYGWIGIDLLDTNIGLYAPHTVN